MIGILNIGMGNLSSVSNAVYEQGFDYSLVSSAADFDDLTHLIIPGVGHFSAAMQQIEKQDLLVPIKDFALNRQSPVLGICLGMQLLADQSEEGGQIPGLGLIPGVVKKFHNQELRVPHVGWNRVDISASHPVLEDIGNERDFYFVHSYFFQCQDSQHSLALTHYGGTFTSIVGRNNVLGCQFHPEKSQKNGLQLIENFCEWDGVC